MSEEKKTKMCAWCNGPLGIQRGSYPIFVCEECWTKPAMLMTARDVAKAAKNVGNSLESTFL